MALIHSLEEEGKFLFRYRGQIPVVLFLVAVPVIFFTDYDKVNPGLICGVEITAIALSALGFLIRIITIGTTPKGTSGRNTKEQVAETLNSTGIYSTVRHPLYVGNYLMWIGIVLYTLNIYYTVIVTLAFWLYYERIMFTEERFLERKFGQAYLDWSKGTPAFIPSFRNYRKNEVPFSWKSVLRREYSGFLATVIGFLFVAVIRDYFTMEHFELKAVYGQVFVAALLITLILRTIKHRTKWLDEEDRS